MKATDEATLLEAVGHALGKLRTELRARDDEVLAQLGLPPLKVDPDLMRMPAAEYRALVARPRVRIACRTGRSW